MKLKNIPKKIFLKKNMCSGILHEFHGRCFPHVYTLGSIWASVCSSQTLQGIKPPAPMIYGYHLSYIYGLVVEGACILFILSVRSNKRELSAQSNKP